jgi:hypothetical protein
MTPKSVRTSSSSPLPKKDSINFFGREKNNFRGRFERQKSNKEKKRRANINHVETGGLADDFFARMCVLAHCLHMHASIGTRQSRWGVLFAGNLPIGLCVSPACAIIRPFLFSYTGYILYSLAIHIKT